MKEKNIFFVVLSTFVVVLALGFIGIRIVIPLIFPPTPTKITVTPPTETPTNPPTPTTETPNPTSTTTETPTPTSLTLIPTDIATPTSTPTGPTETPIPSATMEYYKQILSNAGVLNAKGQLIVGVRYDAPPFGRIEDWENYDCKPSLFDANFQSAVVGYDIRIARELAKRWLGDENLVEFRCVPVGERGKTVREQIENISIGIFAYSYSAKRCDLAEIDGVLCSDPYMLDGQGIFVRKDSGITQLCSDQIQTVAVVTNTSALSRFSNDISSFCGLSTTPAITITTSRKEAIDLVLSGQVDAYATNFEIVWALANEYPEDDINPINGELGPADKFVIAVTPGKENVLNIINEAILDWKEDGTLLKLMKGVPPQLEEYDPPLKCAADPDPTLILELQKNLCGLKPIIGTITYTVQPGDTLGGIAGTLWGDSYLWPCIAAENDIPLDNPRIDDFEPITIPTKPANPANPNDPDPANVDCTY